MIHPLFPAVQNFLAEPTATPDRILPMLEKAEIRLPAIPLLTTMELVQVLPQMVLAGEDTLRHGSLGAGLEFVGLHVLIGGRGVAAEDALGLALVDPPDLVRLLGRDRNRADPRVEAWEMDRTFVTDPVVFLLVALSAEGALEALKDGTFTSRRRRSRAWRAFNY